VVEPSPYLIEKLPVCLVALELLAALNLLLPEQAEAVQVDEGTQRSLLPVSKSIEKVCAGLPMEMLPLQREVWSVKGAACRLVDGGRMRAPGIKLPVFLSAADNPAWIFLLV